MSSTLAETIPVAVTLAASPVPILAVIVMLVTDRGPINAIAFLGGWVIGIVLVAGAVAAVGVSGAERPTDPPAALAVVQLVVAAGCVVIAAETWRRRPRGGMSERQERIVRHVLRVTPSQSMLVGFVLIVLNPLNVLLSVVGGSKLAVSGLDPGGAVAVLGAFTVVASLSIAAPTVVVLSLGERAAPVLVRTRGALEQHGSASIAAVLVVVAIVLAVDGARIL